jgi:hypothetical protein
MAGWLVLWAVAKGVDHLVRENQKRTAAIAASSEFRVAMLGGRRVGKTSALAGMYQRFQEVVDLGNLELGIDETETWTRQEIQSRLDQLESAAADADDPGVDGDGVVRRFLFYISEKNAEKLRHSKIAVQFYDHPGTFLDGAGSGHELDKDNLQVLNANLLRSDAVLIGIDTPYLMECNGSYHQDRNRPREVAQLLKDLYMRKAGSHLLLLVPLRCERYMQTAEDRSALQQAVRAGYSDLLELCASGPLANRVRVVTAPVETTGSLFFSHFDHDRRWRVPAARFSRNAGAVYSPRNSDQPLRHLLHHAVNRLAAARNSTFWGPFDDTSNLRNAVTRFAEGIKQDEGFEVIQDGGWRNGPRAKACA